MQTFLTHEDPARLRRVWNNIGKPNQLGVPDLPSKAAPSTVLDLPGGPGLTASVWIQGLILDSNAPSGVAAITNGIALSIQDNP